MKIIIQFLIFTLLSHSAISQKIFDDQSPEQYIEDTLQIIEKLNAENPEHKRLNQYLVLKIKRTSKEIKPNFVTYYLEETKPCFENWETCLQNESEYKDYITSFYTKIQKENISNIKDSINSLKESKDDINHKRAKFVNLAFKSLLLGVQEIDNPNDDSKTGGNFIRQYFEASGLANPENELTLNKTDEWAWCAAFIASLYNQSGGGFSFLTQEEYKAACKEMGKKSHCHPVQVDFILNWAKKKKQVEEFNIQELDKTKPGDLLALINPRSGQASHIGIYIAKSSNCKEDGNNCWVYTVEGNAGPFINDALEYEWDKVIQIVKDKNISDEDFEKLLDRVTFVKRPLKVWDYKMDIFD